MRRFKGKENINTLLNIDSVFGEYEGHVLPIIITIGLIGLPLLIWLFMLQGTPIKFWWVVIADVPWSVWWATYILGHGKQKMAFYEQQRTDAYRSADELIHTAYIHDDGLIEYDNGSVAYIISGYLRGYLTDDKLSVDMEHFMDELDNWDWDLYFHNTVDELLCENELPKLARYTDKEVIQDRIDFYAYQDEWSRTHTGLYRISFLVTANKYNWKRLKAHLSEVVSSEIALVFNEVEILDHDKVVDIFNRDICGFADIMAMLVAKYDNENYYASKVMWYDDNVPEVYTKEPEHSGLDERRVQ